ncbi:MAG: sulfite exporter TauE/SafE family protein [Verrucomicrobiota bacterium]
MVTDIVLVASILFAAAFLQSATGFGMALVCMAVVPLILPINEAIAFVAISCFIATIFIMLANRSGLSFRHGAPLALGMGLGIPLGYYGLRQLDGDLVVTLLGIVLMAIAVFEFMGTRRAASKAIPGKFGAIFGLAGGVLAGAFNVGGPPVVVYAYSQRWGKVETVAILQSVFLAAGVVRNGLMIKSGEYTADLLTIVAWSVPAALLGVFLGKRILDRLPLEVLKRIVFAMIFVIGLSYVLR